jgi:sulfur carrier protein ThiS
MKLYLGGHLDWYDPHKRAWHDIPLSAPTALLELLQRLGVPAAEVATVAVNGILVDLENVCVYDGDRVELFPAIGGG